MADEFFPPGGVYLLLGHGDGTFQSAVNFPASNLAFAVAAGDLKQDGRLDLLTGNYDTYDVLL